MFSITIRGRTFSLKQLVLGGVAFVLLLSGNLLFRLIYLVPFVNHKRKRFAKEVKPVIRFRSMTGVWLVGVFGLFPCFLLTNYLTGVLVACLQYLSLAMGSLTKANVTIPFDFQVFALRHFLSFQEFLTSPIIAVPVFLIFCGLHIIHVNHNFQKFRDFNNNEDGDDKFVEHAQLKREYKKVPDRNKQYGGYGGFPVAHGCRKNLSGWLLVSKMLWRNETFIRFLTYWEEQLDLFATVCGYYLIEDSTINVLCTGITRSGKDETVINPMLDLISRAKIPSSLVVADPKGETYQSFYKTLRKRNFNVQVLNFQNMDFSMSYNLLNQAIQSAKKGLYEETQQRVKAVSEALYRRGKEAEGNAKFWEDTSIGLFNAIALALIDRAHEVQHVELDAWDTVTVRNVVKFLTDLGSEEVLVNPEGEVVEDGENVQRKSKITVYFENLRKINQEPGHFSKFREMADTEFQTSNFASGETQGNVYASMLSGLSLFLQDNIAKMTSKNSIDLESVGHPRRLSFRLKSNSSNELPNAFAYQTVKLSFFGKRGNLLIKEATAAIDEQGYVQYVIEPFLPKEFEVRLTFDHENTTNLEIKDQEFLLHCRKRFKRARLGAARDRYTKRPILAGIDVTVKQAPSDFKSEEPSEKTMSSSFQIEQIHFVYSEQPVAIFLVTPPNRKEYNGLVSLLVEQLFNANYDLALTTKGRKTVTRIQHILNEFGNLTKIPDMGNKLSIGLGQNICFTLFIQNLEQLIDKYGKEEAATIVGNCSLNCLIKTTSGDSLKQYSELLGSRTVTYRSTSTNTSKFTEESKPVTIQTNTKGQPLMTPTQLAKLEGGEMAVVRSVKPTDQKGRKITTDPIFVHGKTEMPYKFMFLSKVFDSKMTLADIPVECPHRGLDLQTIAIPSSRNFSNLLAFRRDLEVNPGTAQMVGRMEDYYEVHGTNEEQEEPSVEEEEDPA